MAALVPGAAALREELQEFLTLLHSPECTFFPVRHHSPACAWHLRQWIREHKPTQILIEGPDSIDEWIPLLVAPDLRAPVAVYMVSSGQESPAGTGDASGSPPSRFAAYYPLCDYSPELVALREGQAVGAGLHFIDLQYAEQLSTDRSLQGRAEDWRAFSLLHEGHLNSSRYVQRLAARAGCRDHDELWDHLFEIRATEIATDRFIRNVAAYCYLARREYDVAALELDGTLARERVMAKRIAESLHLLAGNAQGHILVVTGGFHTANLPRLLTRGGPAAGATTMRGGCQSYLIRYSFDQLDALNGYAAGMRSPRYYDLIWSYLGRAHPEPYAEAAADLLVEIGRLTRERQAPFAVSAADEIAALEHARLLAAIRGHREPAREDVLDAIRSCFVKGTMDAEGVLFMGLVQKALAGDRLGELPAGAPLPPLLADFRETSARYRLNTEDATRRQTVLEIYRQPRQRKISRFFHCLEFLGIPFARLLAGPDFVTGLGLDRLSETWEYGWSPAVDGALIQAAIFGSTIEEAAANRLGEALLLLEREGRGRSANLAVHFLLRALLMGIHRHVERIIRQIADGIAEDSDFISVVSALRQMVLIQTAREPLEAARIGNLPSLIAAAYRKACYLEQDLYSIPADQTPSTIDSLCILGELVEIGNKDDFDPELFYGPLNTLRGRNQGNAGAIGAAWGLFHRGDRASAEDLRTALIGYLNAATLENQGKTAFIHGLLRTCRELSWREDWFLRALDDLWQTWDESEFIRHLPDLRLAFAGLTPAETDCVAKCAAQLHKAKDLGNLVIYETTEAKVRLHLAVTEAVRQSVTEDGLAAWLGVAARKGGSQA